MGSLGRPVRNYFFGLLAALGIYGAESDPAAAARLTVCHGYSCYYQARVDLNDGRIASIMKAGSASPEAERRAISKAIRYYEQMATSALGVRDRPKSELGRGRLVGQMDCIDESMNTTAVLKLIAAKDLLRFHHVSRRSSRGFFMDNRFPHFAAVIVDPAGRRWAVDSWYEPGGGAPDIMPLDLWKQRGIAGER